ncbi:hypothetical protein NQZ79_g958 [Umbelopsis isabellina]|nr:hypothetical protein NQZ79_g958 [Umbelopsis isabellina]
MAASSTVALSEAAKPSAAKAESAAGMINANSLAIAAVAAVADFHGAGGRPGCSSLLASAETHISSHNSRGRCLCANASSVTFSLNILCLNGAKGK